MNTNQPTIAFPHYTEAAFLEKKPPCDLVMRGGIADGVAYPAAVVELATQYRFAKIGGTSAGAFAAAGVAAAELGRQLLMQERGAAGPSAHFLGLQQMNDDLLRRSQRQSLILRLFASTTTPVTQPVFAIALEIIELLQRSSPIAPPPEADIEPTLIQRAARFGSNLITIGRRIVKFVLSLARLALALLRHNPLWFLGSFLASLWLSQLLPSSSVITTDFGLTGSEQNLPPLQGIAPLPDPLGDLRMLVQSYAGLLLICFLFGAFVSFLQLLWRVFTALPAAPHFFGVCTGLHQPDELAQLLFWLGKLARPRFPALAASLEQRARRRTDARRASSPGLTEWMAGWFNRMAGRQPGDDPVTFSDLSAADIGLQMVTTNLCERRPYVLPFAARDQRRFIFSEVEWSALFPAAVVEYLTSAAAAEAQPGRFTLPPGFFYLPSDPEQLPIVVAARMSLSLPLVISAIPLYTIDERIKTASQQFDALTPLPTHWLRRHLFSDGGATSNFPIHFFDKWLPDRPTFGMRTYNTSNPDADIELRRADNRRDPLYTNITAMFGFVFSMIDTMMNYRDALQSELPSYQERIVAIPLTNDEGGLNLDMGPLTIENIQKKGRAAAQKMLLRGEPGQERFNFEHHWWVRFRTLMWELEEQLSTLERELRVDQASRSQAVGAARAAIQPAEGAKTRLTEAHRQRLAQVLEAIQLAPAPDQSNPLDWLRADRKHRPADNLVDFFAEDYQRRLNQVRLDIEQQQADYPFTGGLDAQWFEGAELRVEILLALIDLWSLPPGDHEHARQVVRIMRELLPEIRTPASQRTGALINNRPRRKRPKHFFAVEGMDVEEATLRVTPRL